LQEPDLIETGICKNDRCTPLASIELAVHRAIYQETPALAIVHAHPPHAVALSLVETEIVPNDAEGLAMIGRVPILGSFAIGQLLEEAYSCTTMLEESCKVTCLLKSLQVEPERE